MPDSDQLFTPKPESRVFGREDFLDGPRDPFGRQAGFGLGGTVQPALRDDFRAALRHYLPTLGPMVGFGFLVWSCSTLLGALHSCLQILSYLFLVFAFHGGYVVVGLRQMRGQEWHFGDLFAGFHWWTPLFLHNFFALLLFLFCFGPGYAAVIGGFIYTVFTPAFAGPGPGGAPPNLWLAFWPVYVGGLVMLLGILPYAYFYTRLFALSPFLIIDQGLGPLPAIRANWEATRAQPWGWFRAGLALTLVYMLGALPCGLGTPFLIQLWYLAFTAAYLRMTGYQQLDGPV